MKRVPSLCTHHSARSRMAEALTRHAARKLGVALEVHSAGTEATRVKEGARAVMTELGLSLDGHTSKTLWDVPDPQNFDHVITVCDFAAEACPVDPARTTRRPFPFADPSGGSLERWREVRDAVAPQFTAFVQGWREGTPGPTSPEGPAVPVS
ncbi:arsenate reductase ArsC [Deinococcus planocerae]|uniref:arsenate reductase ArsC n=1 Tax=Deinococcus planocerae TaxID=1737569 RepID=UPI000C7EDCB8|nr:arsenate reductase ArsC [Deinococcus planocerae]